LFGFRKANSFTAIFFDPACQNYRSRELWLADEAGATPGVAASSAVGSYYGWNDQSIDEQHDCAQHE